MTDFLAISVNPDDTELNAVVRISDISALRVSVVTTVADDDPYIVDLLAVMKNGAEVVLRRFIASEESNPLDDARTACHRAATHLCASVLVVQL